MVFFIFRVVISPIGSIETLSNDYLSVLARVKAKVFSRNISYFAQAKFSIFCIEILQKEHTVILCTIFAKIQKITFSTRLTALVVTCPVVFYADSSMLFGRIFTDFRKYTILCHLYLIKESAIFYR